jgi:hypothetical protein
VVHSPIKLNVERQERWLLDHSLQGLVVIAGQLIVQPHVIVHATIMRPPHDTFNPGDRVIAYEMTGFSHDLNSRPKN